MTRPPAPPPPTRLPGCYSTGTGCCDHPDACAVAPLRAGRVAQILRAGRVAQILANVICSLAIGMFAIAGLYAGAIYDDTAMSSLAGALLGALLMWWLPGHWDAD